MCWQVRKRRHFNSTYVELQTQFAKRENEIKSSGNNRKSVSKRKKFILWKATSR